MNQCKQSPTWLPWNFHENLAQLPSCLDRRTTCYHVRVATIAPPWQAKLDGVPERRTIRHLQLETLIPLLALPGNVPCLDGSHDRRTNEPGGGGNMLEMGSSRQVQYDHPQTFQSIILKDRDGNPRLTMRQDQRERWDPFKGTDIGPSMSCARRHEFSAWDFVPPLKGTCHTKQKPRAVKVGFISHGAIIPPEEASNICQHKQLSPRLVLRCTSLPQPCQKELCQTARKASEQGDPSVRREPSYAGRPAEGQPDVPEGGGRKSWTNCCNKARVCAMFLQQLLKRGRNWHARRHLCKWFFCWRCAFGSGWPIGGRTWTRTPWRPVTIARWSGTAWLQGGASLFGGRHGAQEADWWFPVDMTRFIK